MVTSLRLVSYILSDLGLRGELLTKQATFLLQPYVQPLKIMLQNFASIFSPATIALANLHETQVCMRYLAIFKWYASEPTQDKLNWDKMVDMITAGAHGVSNPRL